MTVTPFQLFIQFVVFIVVVCMLMPLLGAFLTHRGLQVLGLVEPPVSAEKTDSKEGGSSFKPPQKATYYFCLKVFLSATFTGLVFMFMLGWVIAVPNQLGVRVAICASVEAATAVALLRRFTVPAILIVVVVAALVNTIGFGTMYYVSQLASEKATPTRQVHASAVSPFHS